ncbi:MAG: hypothetical protein NTZ97_02560 [Candidatus Moranbacteria bacterium]|nr:hypothetical protein [Candidatus Moranbacteria bacterium]
MKKKKTSLNATGAFLAAIEKYLDDINECWRSRQGEDINLNPMMNKAAKLYKKIPGIKKADALIKAINFLIQRKGKDERYDSNMLNHIQNLLERFSI